MHVLAREASEFYEVSAATINGKAIAVAGGLRLVPDGDLRLLHDTETVIVPGYAGASTKKLDKATLGILDACAKRGARMVSICSGTFALAQTGLLNGLTVTTHWSLCDDLARQYSAVTVDPTVLFVDNYSVRFEKVLEPSVAHRLGDLGEPGARGSTSAGCSLMLRATLNATSPASQAATFVLSAIRAPYCSRHDAIPKKDHSRDAS